MIKIAFFSVVLNHHQAALADELYVLTNRQFVFVELVEPSTENFKGGINVFSNRPYLLQSWKDEISRRQADDIALSAEVALFGSGLKYLKQRMKKGLLSFEIGERWLKRGWLNLLSPRLLKNMWYYHTNQWGKKPLFKLCASAYAATDQYKLFTFFNRCYKWGYFTIVDNIDLDEYKYRVPTTESTSLMWCARFLKWKHPELPIMLAHKLKTNGYRIIIDMYGVGDYLEYSKDLCKELDVTDIVRFKGSVPNAQIVEAMRQHDIFLFTSDRNEGWGVVLNEAMSNGCTVVASNEIGSVPFLLNNGENGMIFKSGNLESLYEKVVFLLNNPSDCHHMAIKAYQHIKNVWSPHVAATNLLQLIDDLKNGRDSSIKVGPCSKVMP